MTTPTPEQIEAAVKKIKQPLEPPYIVDAVKWEESVWTIEQALTAKDYRIKELEEALTECRTDYQNARDACASLAFTSDSYPTRLLAHERCHSIYLRINNINQALAAKE